MKGIDLAEAYYKAHGVPMINERFRPYADKIAVGLSGPGSECFGYDDEISRDHDWGPAFCMWLRDEDFQEIGKTLQEAYERLPKSFLGFSPRQSSPGEEYRAGVNTIKRFYVTYTGLDHAPAGLEEWLCISEQALATCTNGRIFSDPCGIFTAWREALLRFYPEDVRLKKITSYCISAGQAGQYNLPRSLKRGELVTARYAETKFCADAISLVFLLNKRYAPFYKWMHRAVQELPVLGEIVHVRISSLVEEADRERKMQIIEEICDRISDEFRREGFSDAKGNFLLDHARSIHSGIRDDKLRRKIVVL